MIDPRCKSVPAGWVPAIASWRLSLVAAGRSAETIRTRIDHLQRVARAMGGSPWRVDDEQLLSWCGRQAWSRETRRSVYVSLRGFYAWAMQLGHTRRSPAGCLPTVRAVEPAPRPAPVGVVRSAVDGADGRTALILRAAMTAGLRRAEIAQIHERDLVEDLLGWSLWVHGKGDKLRLVPISDDLAAELLAACRAGGGYALPGDVDGHLSAQYVGVLASRALPAGWTLHTLRHSFATRAHAATLDLMSVRDLLGHASVATTQRYVATDDSARRRAMLAAA